MAPNAKRVFYVKYLSGPVFGEILAKRPDIQLDKLENETPDAEAEPVLSQAHAYQIGASRQVIGRAEGILMHVQLAILRQLDAPAHDILPVVIARREPQ